jgi:hypothetical protein
MGGQVAACVSTRTIGCLLSACTVKTASGAIVGEVARRLVQPPRAKAAATAAHTNSSFFGMTNIVSDSWAVDKSALQASHPYLVTVFFALQWRRRCWIHRCLYRFDRRAVCCAQTTGLDDPYGRHYTVAQTKLHACATLKVQSSCSSRNFKHRLYRRSQLGVVRGGRVYGSSHRRRWWWR